MYKNTKYANIPYKLIKRACVGEGTFLKIASQNTKRKEIDLCSLHMIYPVC